MNHSQIVPLIFEFFEQEFLSFWNPKVRNVSSFMFRSWEDFYGTGNPTEIVYIEKNSPQTLTENSIFVTNSLFNAFSSSTQGRCISVTNSNCDFLIEETSFIEITSSQNAIALYLSIKNAIYNKICGFGCKTTACSFGIFDYVNLNDSIENKNQILSSTIAYTTSACAYYIVYHRYGQIIAKETNFSHNECYHISAIICYPSYSQGRVSCLLSFSSFSNNIATKDYGCIYFGTTNSFIDNQIQACNIIKNKQVNYLGLIYSGSRLIINYSCIVNNEASPLISLRSDSASVFLNTFIDVQQLAATIITVNAQSKTFVNILKMFETRECAALFEPIEGAIAVDLMKKSVCYNTKGNCKERKRLLSLNLFSN